MKLSNLIKSSVCLLGISLIAVGCLTQKQVTPATSTSPAVTNTVVNQANLLLDTSILQGATTVVVSYVVQKDSSVVPALKDASIALTGVINGANTNSTSQILGVLGQSSNTTLATEISPLVSTVSGLEQNLLAKYGTNVAEQISLAIAKSVNAGLVAGLGSK